MILISMYLTAIVLANLSVAYFGPQFAIVNSFVLIGLDLTVRDALHERWRGRNLWRNMLLLIGGGSVLSALLSIQALPIAIASFVAFSATGITDTLVYQLLGHRARLLRMNGSNVVSAGVDSLVFSALAFGFPLLWGIIAGQYIAKVAGGFVWSLVLNHATQRLPLFRR